MTQPLLSILIPTVVGREENISNLIKIISEQHKFTHGTASESFNPMGLKSDEVEMFWLKDNKEMTIGEKREKMYQMANGLYSIMVDDDDEIAPNAIELILEAIKSNPEIPCITFRERCMINGQYKSSNHSIKYPQWMDNNDGYDFVRCAFYKDVIRTDIAKSVPFPHIRYNEDEQWSMAIKPFLADEIHIDQELYHYIYNETNHQERYGLDRSS